MTKEPIILPADTCDTEDRDVSAKGMDRGQCARLVRMTRFNLGLSQFDFSARFRVPLGTLRDWEQARATPPPHALAYIKVIALHPGLVQEAVA